MRLSFVLFCILSASTRASEDLYQSIQILLDALSHIVNFMDEHYYEINFDGLLGVVIAECKLLVFVLNSLIFTFFCFSAAF